MQRVGILVLAVFIAGCSVLSHEAPVEDIDKAAALFFQRLENHDYDAIYDDAAKAFKQRKTREQVTENLKQITAFGKIGDYQRVRMPQEGEGKERMLSPVFATVFEQVRGDLTLNFRDEGGEWKLIGFVFKPHGSQAGQ